MFKFFVPLELKNSNHSSIHNIGVTKLFKNFKNGILLHSCCCYKNFNFFKDLQATVGVGVGGAVNGALTGVGDTTKGLTTGLGGLLGHTLSGLGGSLGAVTRGDANGAVRFLFFV